MADTTTPKLGMTLPEVGASSETWGTKLNADLNIVDGLFDTGPVLKLAKGGTGAATAADARTNLGLGTMATQAASAVSITGGTITGGSISGITDLAIADGGTGASTAADARTNLGLVIGSNVQAFDADLSAVAELSTGGLVAKTGSGTAAARVLTAGSGITVGNGDGVSGNPTIAVSDLAVSNFAAATIITASETIGANNNDTTLPTSAAVKTYADGSASLATNGSANLPSGLQLRWGSAISISDGAETFSFASAFSTDCVFVTVQRTASNAQDILPVTAKSVSGFTIDRDGAIDNNQPFMYFALGY